QSTGNRAYCDDALSIHFCGCAACGIARVCLSNFGGYSSKCNASGLKRGARRDDRDTSEVHVHRCKARRGLWPRIISDTARAALTRIPGWLDLQDSVHRLAMGEGATESRPA